MRRVVGEFQGNLNIRRLRIDVDHAAGPCEPETTSGRQVIPLGKIADFIAGERT
jgi:hypothetical protein